MWDVAVIGGGPAGLSAATWLGRYRRRTILFDSGEYRNRWVDESHGYLGLDCVNPAELRERALADLKRYSVVERRADRVTAARVTDGMFELSTDEERVEARRVVLATGVRDVFPEITNFFEHYGASVFNCPSCDGYEAKGKSVVVFGWNEEVVRFARSLLEWAFEVTIVTDGARFEGSSTEGLTVLEKDATELVGPRGDLRGVRFADGSGISCEAAFISIDQQPVTDLAEMLGCALSDEGCVCVNEHGMTTVEGVYAAGDIVQGPQLIQVAAATGAIAGVACAKSLS